MKNGKSSLKGIVAALAMLALSMSACSNEKPHGPEVTGDDDRITVSPVSDSDKDAVCEAIRNGVTAYAGSTPDVGDEPPQAGQEYCYYIRGDGAANYVSGMLRVHEFSDDDIDTYSAAIRQDGEATGECFNYMTLAADKDQQFNAAPASFSNSDEGGRDHCVANSDEATVVAFTITGAIVVVEFNAVGKLDGKTVNIAAVYDSVLPTVFDALES